MTIGRTEMIVLCLLLMFDQQRLYSQAAGTKVLLESGTRQPKKQTESFVDYSLKRLNPTDKNYGECIDEAHRVLLSETIEKGYFWSNVVTLGLLLIFFLAIVFQWGLLKRRALMYANALAQYQSALARAEVQTDEATKRNHTFMEALRLAMDPAVRKPSEAVSLVAVPAGMTSPPADTSTKLRKVKDSPVASSVPAAADKPGPSGANSASGNGQNRGNAVDPVVPGLDLIAQNNALQQQLGLTQDQVKQLRRQLNESERQLQTEKQKNRTLKGE